MVLNTFVISQESLQLGTKAQIVAGIDAIVEAKMMGMTPDMFTFMGRCVLWPP